jgi:serine/threonine protein kinase
MEYVNGIVMSKYIDDFHANSSRLRNKYLTQFYSAILLVVIDYLNKKRIAHRDIKPDNIMINENVLIIVKQGLYQAH